ncbi:hypothetical protein [Pelosinus sp. UFO1]|uniref:hypothetical protein n=1 Tax=Pelosinus sp. UFO1 TaxID=484770 RepID=UPI0004D10006|nr:hypothetical protein [Pelosinus sp. UFO1]AIF51648.1 hypothetical protein UFO1_2101 [Pelosinus sp. UFO1]
MSNYKVFVEVTARHDLQGNIRPLSIKWEDGRVFEVDRLLDVRQAASLKAGGMGMRYTCRICNKRMYLFCDQGKWFMERK